MLAIVNIAMRSRDRDTNEASPKKKMKWYTVFTKWLVERSRSHRL